MESIGVECRFEADGSVTVRRVELEGGWRAVEQGRQWLDEAGRHVLVRIADQRPIELLLRRQALQWERRDMPGRDLHVA